MKTTLTHPSKTQVHIVFTADQAEIDGAKKLALQHLASTVKVQGFREGKAPLELVEKEVNREVFIQEFLDEIMSRLYMSAVNDHKLRPVSPPQGEIIKFVPFTTLEFSTTVDIVPEIKLVDYKKIKKSAASATITGKDIDEVIESLRIRLAKKEDVDRAAKDGDQVWIDFSGKDQKGEDVKGASGKDYPLNLGSKTFIPGFEENLLGLKAGEHKDFDVTFPKDYGVKALQSKKVTFSVDVTKVQSVTLPSVDDKFAAEAGPFKTLADLKADIKKQLTTEKQAEAERKLQNEIIDEIIEKSDVDVPETVLKTYIDDMLSEAKQNLTYRGLTYPEFLESTGQTEQEHLDKEIKPFAEKRAKASLILAQIAEAEKLMVTPEELEIRLSLLKGQYQDEQMQAQLNSEQAQRDITAQLLSEKTIQKLVNYATKK